MYTAAEPVTADGSIPVITSPVMDVADCAAATTRAEERRVSGEEAVAHDGGGAPELAEDDDDEDDDDDVSRHRHTPASSSVRVRLLRALNRCTTCPCLSNTRSRSTSVKSSVVEYFSTSMICEDTEDV